MNLPDHIASDGTVSGLVVAVIVLLAKEALAWLHSVRRVHSRLDRQKKAIARQGKAIVQLAVKAGVDVGDLDEKAHDDD